MLKREFHAFVMCQSMFCAFPCLWKIWDEDAKGKMLAYLPVVGLEIGFLWAALGWLCRFLSLPPLITGLVLGAYPYLATGYIHLDGFMDVTDAVKSWRDPARRREILKDSHVGSFAVIACILLMMAQFALFASLKAGTDLRMLVLIPVMSRCGSGLAVCLLPSMNTSQYAGQEKPKTQSAALAVVLLVAVAAGFLVCGQYGWALPGGMAAHVLAVRRGYRSLEGMNGDISGYALTVAELAAAAVLVLI